MFRFAKIERRTDVFDAKAKKPFRLTVESDSITFYPSSGTPFFPELEKYVAVFNRHRTFTPSDYPAKLWSRSYFVSLVHAMLDEGASFSDPAATLLADLREILNAPPTEREELRNAEWVKGNSRNR